MRRLRRVKIIATLGPASVDKAVVTGLAVAGADVFRINMSHTDHAGLGNYVRMIREIEQELGRAIGVLVDLQGPKLRIGAFAEGSVHLRKGDSFVFDSDPDPGDATRVRLPHPEILAALKVDDTILIDDGKVRLHVVEATPESSRAVVDVAGRLSNRKGVSLPDTDIPITSMTSKDRADLEAALAEGVDWVAISFVQRPEDVVEVKKLTQGRALVMAKIEKPQAITRLEEVIEVSDALMVARGDLGVEVPLEKVPGLQKRINRSARRLGKPVVVATQMLEVDDSFAAADARRGVRRGDRGVRRRGRRHALRRERRRPISAGSRGDDEPHRRGSGDRYGLSHHHQRAARRRAQSDARRRHRRRRPRRGANSRRQGDLRLDAIPARRRFASPASVRFRPSWR